MSKKQWIITAAVVLAIVAVMSVFCFPRKASRVLDLPTEMPVSIWGEVLRDLEEPQSFRTRDTDQIAEAEALLEELELRRSGDDNCVTTYNGVYNAKVTLTYADGTRCDFFLYGDGRLRCDEKNYAAADAAVIEELMAKVRSWILAK